jgi:acetylornithine deacetylase/succinyl-diaminopimelate desuccinylase-like protein
VQSSLAGLAHVGIPPVTATYGFCTNGSLTAGLRAIPTIGFGIGREQEAHMVDEFVKLDNLYRGANGYTAIADRLLDLDVAPKVD